MTSQRQDKCSDPYAVDIRLTKNGECLRLRLEDGREFCVPFAWYRGLRLAPLTARRKMTKWSGIGVEWPDISRDLSVRGMVADCVERGVEPTFWRRPQQRKPQRQRRQVRRASKT